MLSLYGNCEPILLKDRLYYWQNKLKEEELTYVLNTFQQKNWMKLVERLQLEKKFISPESGYKYRVHQTLIPEIKKIIDKSTIVRGKIRFYSHDTYQNDKYGFFDIGKDCSWINRISTNNESRQKMINIRDTCLRLGTILEKMERTVEYRFPV
jgi:hypothetical protein